MPPLTPQFLEPENHYLLKWSYVLVWVSPFSSSWLCSSHPGGMLSLPCRRRGIRTLSPGTTCSRSGPGAARYHLDACATPIASFAFPCSQSSRNAFSDRSRRCCRRRHPHLTRLRLSLPSILPSRNLLRSRFAFYSPGGSIPSQQRASLRRSPRTANTS